MREDEPWQRVGYRDKRLYALPILWCVTYSMKLTSEKHTQRKPKRFLRRCTADDPGVLDNR